MIVSFIRHGSTSWNEQGRMQGRRDIPLSEAGRAQVDGWRLPADSMGPASWFTSPLCRAAETAERLADRPQVCADALIEMDWGMWEGLTLDEIRARDGAAFADAESLGFDFRAPGGESPRDVRERLRPWLVRAAVSPVPVLAVTHLGVLRVILAAATGWDMTGKPPIRLQGEAMHRFALDQRGQVSIIECNIPLATDRRSASP